MKIVYELPRLSLMFAICLLAGLVLTAGQALAGEPIRLRLLSYNIHHGEGTDRQLDLERIAAVIRSVKPDLVSLQEVDKKASRSDSVDQAAELGRLTGLHAVHGANIELQGGHYGNAILSRVPFQNTRNLHLPRRNKGEQRGVLIGQFQWPDSEQTLVFMATHFDHRPNDQERRDSAQVINDLVTQEKHPSILAGDLNDTLDSPTLKALKAHWAPTNSQPLPTWPADTPKVQIDFLLLHPISKWKVLETRVLDEAIASDHRALFSVVEYQPE